MSKAILSSDDIVGAQWTLHYEAPSRRIRLMPMADVSHFVRALSGPASDVIFDSVSDVVISSRDAFVIGQCMACEIRENGGGLACAMVFDDFGAPVSIRFECESFRRP